MTTPIRPGLHSEGGRPGGRAVPAAFADRYVPVRQVGRGTTSDVYLARDLVLERPVAVKVLRPELAGDPAAVARFQRRAHATAKLAHPNVIQVYDLGANDLGPFVIMEYVDGPSLSSLGGQQCPTPADLARIAAEIATALEYARGRGIVHGEFGPDDVRLDGHGHARVGNFTTGDRPGAPEPVDADEPAPDLHILGWALLQFLMGSLPQGDPAVPPELFAPPVIEPASGSAPTESAELVAIAHKAMAGPARGRYESLVALREDLSSIAAPSATRPDRSTPGSARRGSGPTSGSLQRRARFPSIGRGPGRWFESPSARLLARSRRHRATPRTEPSAIAAAPNRRTRSRASRRWPATLLTASTMFRRTRGHSESTSAGFADAPAGDLHPGLGRRPPRRRPHRSPCG